MGKSKDVITQIKKATRRKFSADEKIRIVLEGFRGEVAISEICRRETVTILLWQAVRPGTVKVVTTNPAKDVRADR